MPPKILNAVVGHTIDTTDGWLAQSDYVLPVGVIGIEIAAGAGISIDDFLQANNPAVSPLYIKLGDGVHTWAELPTYLDTPIPVADTTTEGIVRLATTAMVLAGTDNTRAVTPAGLKAALDALGASTAKFSKIGFNTSNGEFALSNGVWTQLVSTLELPVIDGGEDWRDPGNKNALRMILTEPGMYTARVNLLSNRYPAAGVYVQVRQNNGAISPRSGDWLAVTGTWMALELNVTFRGVVGDIIDVYAQAVSGTAKLHASSTFCTLTLEKK